MMHVRTDFLNGGMNIIRNTVSELFLSIYIWISQSTKVSVSSIYLNKSYLSRPGSTLLVGRLGCCSLAWSIPSCHTLQIRPYRHNLHTCHMDLETSLLTQSAFHCTDNLQDKTRIFNSISYLKSVFVSRCQYNITGKHSHKRISCIFSIGKFSINLN